MIKRLTKHGNSLAVVIEKPILDLLKIDAETPLEVTTDGNSLTLVPVTDAKRREKFEAALSRTNRRYGKVLKKLAE